MSTTLSNSTKALIASDYCRYMGTEDASLLRMWLYTLRNHCFAFNFWWRASKSSNRVVSLVGRLMKHRIGSRHGLQIPREVRIGRGFYIGHGEGVIISPSAVIGNNCNISQFTTIGSNRGHAATIGDNVYLGPSVCVVEDVTIGSNATIGAGSVVVKDIPENATAVGAPARPVNYDMPGQFVGRRCRVE